jgi:hypothetical protein
MLPDQILTAIAQGLDQLDLEPLIHAKVLAAVFAPLFAEPPKPPAQLSDRAHGHDLPPRRAKQRKPRKSNGPGPSTQAAMTFLKDQLASGPKLAAEIDAAAAKRQIRPIAIARAKTQLKITPMRVNSGHGNAVQLALPAS